MLLRSPRLRKTLKTHQQPDTVWFNLDADVIAAPRHGIKSGVAQVVLNYARVSRGPWRLKAFIDEDGHPVTSRFLVIRARSDVWSKEALWAICNSPFANAYSYAFSSKRDVLAGLMREMPIPDCDAQSLSPLVNAVDAYLAAARKQESDIFVSPVSSDDLRTLHWRIDAEVMRLYSLPAKLERQLLDLFSGVERRGVPFQQREFFPKGFTDPLRLSELLSITADWARINERRSHLIVRNMQEALSSNDRTELKYLQSLADSRVRLLAPLPINCMEKIKDQLQGMGMWEGN
jgi:hypothetical protein